MLHQVTLVYTEPLLRKAVNAFWRRTMGAGFPVALAAVALGVVALVLQGNTSWVLGMLSTALVIGVAFSISLYFVHYRGLLRKFRAIGSPQAVFLADDSSFTFRSGIGTTTLQWSTVKELWQFSEVWLLLYSKAQFSTLPVACLSPEVQAFVVQRIQAAGGKVDG